MAIRQVFYCRLYGQTCGIQGEHVHVLDPGAGSGILSAALIDNLVSRGVKQDEAR